jgi:hypothetical protein
LPAVVLGVVVSLVGIGIYFLAAYISNRSKELETNNWSVDSIVLAVSYFLICLAAYFLSTFLGKKAISFILFPYGNNLIKNKYHLEKNLQMARELSATLEKVAGAVVHSLNLQEHRIEVE